MPARKRTTKRTRQRNTRITIETNLTPEQLEKLSKIFTAKSAGEIELPVSPDSIIKMQKS